MDLFIYVLVAVSWFVLSVLFHELGHWLGSWILGLKASFGFDKRGPFVMVIDGSESDNVRVGLLGVFLGFIPSIIAWSWFGWFFGVMFLVAYGLGVWGEFKSLLGSLEDVA